VSDDADNTGYAVRARDQFELIDAVHGHTEAHGVRPRVHVAARRVQAHVDVDGRAVRVDDAAQLATGLRAAPSRRHRSTAERVNVVAASPRRRAHN